MENNIFSGIEIEKNWINNFDLSFKLEHLPSIFFSVKINEHKKNISNTISNHNYSNYYFNYFQPMWNFNIKNTHGDYGKKITFIIIMFRTTIIFSIILI